MKDFENHDEQVIDLGQASVETKGGAGIELDVSSGKLVFGAGLSDD